MSRRHRVIGPNEEQRQRMVADSMKHLAKLIGPAKQVTDIDQLINIAKSKISEVRKHLDDIDKAVKAAGNDHNRKMLQETAQQMLIERFYTFDKESLLLILVCQTADLLVREVV